jgi:PncC family amidohydrolase
MAESPTVAAELVAALLGRGETVATAESLTGGLLAGAITAVAGASSVYVGGVVSYATRAKEELLAVPAELVVEEGVVSAACAESMARGVRRLLGTVYGVSTTGVAGPDSQEGRPVGTVYVGLATAAGSWSVELALAGDRARIREATVEAALAELMRALG